MRERRNATAWFAALLERRSQTADSHSRTSGVETGPRRNSGEMTSLAWSLAVADHWAMALISEERSCSGCRPESIARAGQRQRWSSVNWIGMAKHRVRSQNPELLRELPERPLFAKRGLHDPSTQNSRLLQALPALAPGNHSERMGGPTRPVFHPGGPGGLKQVPRLRTRKLG